MSFKIIDLEKYERKEHFLHYLNEVPCSYSITANIDITGILNELKKRGYKFYPVILFAITKTANTHIEFRMALDEKGRLGYYSFVNPTYTIFHKDDNTFSNIWTEYDGNFKRFYSNYKNDIQEYGNAKGFITKPRTESNFINISSIPWVSFTGFHLNISKSEKYLLPIFTVGEFFEDRKRILLPLSIQVNHSVCDGFHTSSFINELQKMLTNYKEWFED